MPQGKTPLLPLIRDLANNISPQDLQKMKLGCRNHLPRKALNGIKTSRELFKTLVDKGFFNQNNATFLKRLLRDAGKADLLPYVEKYEEGRETLLPRDKVVELKVAGYEPITVQLAHPTSHLSTGTMEMVRGTLGNLLATATPTADVFYRTWTPVGRGVEVTFLVPTFCAEQLQAEAANRRDALKLAGITAVQRENCADTTLLLPPITAPPRAASVEVPHKLYPPLVHPEALQSLNLITPDQSQGRRPLILPSIKTNAGLVTDDKKDSFLAAGARVRALHRQLSLVRTQKTLSGEEEQRLMGLLRDAEQEEQSWKQDYEEFLSTLEMAAETQAKVETQSFMRTETQEPKVEKQKVEQRSVSPDLGHTLAEGIIQAAKEGDLQMVRLLLTSGCDLGSKDAAGWTALHWACHKGHLGVSQELLKAGADVFSIDQTKKTALHMAAEQGHAGIAEALLKNGSSVNMRDKEGRLPMHLAAIAGRDVAVETLAKACSRSLLNDSDMSGFTALHHAADRGFAPVVQNLLKAGANVNAKDLREFRTPLDLAEEKNHTKVVILLYNAGGGYGRAIKEMPATPIKKSESKQSLATISSSEDSGYMDGDAPPLQEEGEPEPPPPPPVDPEMLFSGARRGDLNRVLEYKEKGGDMNVKDKYGYTALHMATLKAHHRVVEFLCQLGVDINATDKNGWTSLHRACSRGYLYIVHELVKGKADINLRDGDGFTSLQRAASKGHMDIVDLLLSHGADVNSADKLGWTALHGAASGGHADMVKKLLSLGADVQARDVVGKSPTSLAYDEQVAKKLMDAKKWL
ncbi:serine/threonine-protein phosphatase 6 regulatory ankyrin repeat subunit A-like isoform X1 [Branchiostoma lanceolatum]|uniref:serine/threonine-protein phosphatase 6 regulatory ankyrin repeat subunit A-like isoform X1 n=2 Tax=Branchiostoma lanceolatum TaxID=7740 RepID=UPI00345226A1